MEVVCDDDGFSFARHIILNDLPKLNEDMARIVRWPSVDLGE